MRVFAYIREPGPPTDWIKDTIGGKGGRWNLTFKDHKKVLPDVISLSQLLIPAMTESWFAKKYAKGDYQLDSVAPKDLLTLLKDEDGPHALTLPPVLMQELLYKLLYLDSVEHVRYELGERLTSYDVEKFVQTLRDNVSAAFELKDNVTRFCGGTFAYLWKKAGVKISYQNTEGDTVTHEEPPLSFTKLFVEIKAKPKPPA